MSEGIKTPCRLCTKDGRKVGNAFCLTWFAAKPLTYDVETDFGNNLKITESEILELWWVMVDEPPITYEQWKMERNKNVRKSTTSSK